MNGSTFLQEMFSVNQPEEKPNLEGKTSETLPHDVIFRIFFAAGTILDWFQPQIETKWKFRSRLDEWKSHYPRTGINSFCEIFFLRIHIPRFIFEVKDWQSWGLTTEAENPKNSYFLIFKLIYSHHLIHFFISENFQIQVLNSTNPVSGRLSKKSLFVSHFHYFFN